MIQPLVTDKEQLCIKSDKATPDDAQVIQDLLDTFEEHADECTCMAANMIGAHKRIIVITGLDGQAQVMVNPKIVDKKKAYFAKEGCICRPNGNDRGAKRYQRIKVTYQDADFEEHTETFQGFFAENVQHAVDHCNGIYI